MKRIFYLVSINVMRNLEWIPLANSPYLEFDFNLMFEDRFWFYLRKDKGLDEELKDFYLWSIQEDKQTLFEKSCKELNIVVKNYDQSFYYNEYKQQNQIYIPTKQKEIATTDCVEICSESFSKIICGPGTTQILLEHYIDEKDSITLYINSNEITKHNIPHCHVKYKSDKNYCVLSLVDFTKIEPDGGRKNAIICKAQSILKNNIQLARKTWNEIHSLFKFKMVEGQYTSEYEKKH